MNSIFSNLFSSQTITPASFPTILLSLVAFTLFALSSTFASYDHIRAWAKSKGCRRITLNVWTCNPGAMQFYEKLGLEPYRVGMEMIL